jgi:hypothetical protein
LPVAARTGRAVYDSVGFVKALFGLLAVDDFSVVMSKDSTPATPDEMKAFQEILESLFWFPVTVHIEK